MVETITPVVHGRRTGYVLAVALHTAAASTTAALTGIALGSIGMVLGAPWGSAGAAAVAGVAALYLLREVARIPVPLPNARRQVPEWWRTFFSPPVAATLYGAGLGIAFITYLSYGTFVAVAAAALVSGDPLTGALVCAPFGLARGLSVAVIGGRSADPASAAAAVAHLAGGNGPRFVNALALAAVAAVALVVAL